MTVKKNNDPLVVSEASGSYNLPTKENILNNDRLSQAIVDGSGIFELIDLVIADLAENCVHLKYDRMKYEKDEKDIDRIVLRHSNVLKMIMDSLIQKRKLALNDVINLRSPQWQLVFEELMKRVRDTLFEIELTAEQIELFFDKFNKNLEGFEEETEIKLKETLNTLG